MKRSGGAGTAKTLEKLEKSVQEGNYYEAQQMYKTVYARYMAARKFTEAMDLLQSGASIQLRHGQVTCGVELGVLLVETFRKAKVCFEKSAVDRIKSIFNEFPRIQSKEEVQKHKNSEVNVEAKTNVEGCSTFIKTAIKWSIDSGGPSRGSPELHDIFAEYIWTQSPEMDIGKVSLHFVRGDHPELYAAALVDYMEKCDIVQADLLIARGVLLYLALGNLRDANQLVDEVKLCLQGKTSKDFPNSPLMDFVKFLLLTLERDALPLFRMLRENYKTSVGRDPLFDECLDEVAEQFYGVHRRNGLQGMLGELFKMFATEAIP